MKEFYAQMDKHGRLLIPSELRHSLGFIPGTKFSLRASNDELHIISLEKVLKAAQKLFSERHKSKFSAVDEFLKQKYIDAAKENHEY